MSSTRLMPSLAHLHMHFSAVRVWRQLRGCALHFLRADRAARVWWRGRKPTLGSKHGGHRGGGQPVPLQLLPPDGLARWAGGSWAALACWQLSLRGTELSIWGDECARTGVPRRVHHSPDQLSPGRGLASNRPHHPLLGPWSVPFASLAGPSLTLKYLAKLC